MVWTTLALFVLFGLVGLQFLLRPRPRQVDGAAFWTGDPWASKEKKSHADLITCIAFSPDGKSILVGTERGRADFVDMVLEQTTTSTIGHASTIIGVGYRLGQLKAFTVSKDGMVLEWTGNTSRRFNLESERTTRWGAMAISADEKSLALATSSNDTDNSIQIFDADSGRWRQTIPTGHSAGPIEFTKDGTSIFGISLDEARSNLWDFVTGELKWSRGNKRAQPNPPIDAPFFSGGALGPGDDEYSIAIDNSWGDGSLVIFDMDTGRERRVFTSKSGHLKFALSPDGRFLAISGYVPVIEIWEVKTGKLAKRIEANQERIWCLAFSADSRFLATGGQDGTVIVWNVGG